MGARTSSEMLRAIELIKQGKTRYEAAKETGLRITSITRSKLYKALVEHGAPKEKA